MSNRDERGRFAATSSANPHSLTPAQPFGYAKPYNHSNAATAPAPIDLTAKYGQKGGPRPARIPAGGPRPLGMVSDLALQLGRPIERPEQERASQPEETSGPVQPPFKAQEPVAEARPALPAAEQLPAMPGSGRLALLAGPSAVESMTPGSPIPPAVDGLLSSHGTPPSFGTVSLDSRYTRASNPHQIIQGEVIS